MVAMAVGAVVTGGAAPAEPAPPATTVYRHATVLDGTGAAPLRDMAVIVRGDRIQRVAPDAQLARALPAGATIVDLSGRYLLPGLIDSHQHVATPPNRRRAEALMRRDLYSGITATRIMADDLRAVAELARAAHVAEIASPDLVYAALFAGPSFFDDPRVLDAALIAAGQAVEHYEITRYGTLIAWAKQLGRSDCAALFQQNLDEEKAADKKLTAMAETNVNRKAA